VTLEAHDEVFKRVAARRANEYTVQVRCGELFLRNGNWAEAGTCFARACDVRPENKDLWDKRGQCAAYLAQWADAAESYRRALELNPKDSLLALKAGCLLARGGHQDAYRRHCAHMWEHHRSAFNAEHLGRLGLTMGAAPGGIADPALTLQAMERALKRQRNDRTILLAMALVQYRAGKAEDALGTLEGIAPLQGSRATDSARLGDAVRCLAYHRLGRTAEARRALHETTRWYEEEQSRLPRTPFTPVTPTWWDWALYETLIQEARAALP
jgi:tetratricopeptide (TPR) repeat protein